MTLDFALRLLQGVNFLVVQSFFVAWSKWLNTSTNSYEIFANFGFGLKKKPKNIPPYSNEKQTVRTSGLRKFGYNFSVLSKTPLLHK